MRWPYILFHQSFSLFGGYHPITTRKLLKDFNSCNAPTIKVLALVLATKERIFLNKAGQETHRGISHIYGITMMAILRTSSTKMLIKMAIKSRLNRPHLHTQTWRMRNLSYFYTHFYLLFPPWQALFSYLKFDL